MVGMKDEVMKREPFPDAGKVTTAVVIGEHPFNVPGFTNMLRNMPEIDGYLQPLDQFVADWGHVRTRYDVVLFYNWHLDTPPDNERGWWQEGTQEALEQLGNGAGHRHAAYGHHGVPPVGLLVTTGRHSPSDSWNRSYAARSPRTVLWGDASP